jgi:hypothetical protein
MCYTDPFVQEPRTAEQSGLMSRLTGWLNDPKKRPHRATAGPGAKGSAECIAALCRGWPPATR